MSIPPNTRTSNDKPTAGARQIVATYPYLDEVGALLYETVRYEPKDFRQRRPNGNGGWTWTLDGVRRVPYRLPELITRADLPLIIVEGEKDADRLCSLGLAATTNAGGAGNWHTIDRDTVNGIVECRLVFVIPDNDDAGRKHAQQVAASIERYAAGVHIVELPGLPAKGDVSDWLAIDGNNLDKLAQLFESAVRTKPSRGDAWEGDAPAPESPVTDWSPFTPLPTVPGVPPFPLEVLPSGLAMLCSEIEFAMNAPVDFAAVAVLALAGGALANSRQLSIGRTYAESACLYAAIVGRPGSAKTPPLKLLRRPFDERQAILLDEWRAEAEKWETADEDSRGPRPIPKRIIVSDVTTESLAMLLAENRRGLMMVRDELLELMSSLNQYKGGKGSDRQIFLKLWSGDTIFIDRKSDRSLAGGPIHALHPFCGIFGGLQPGVLNDFRGKRVADGHLDRWLWSYPADRPAVGESWRDVSAESLRLWTTVVDRLAVLEQVSDGEAPRPKYVHLTADAKPVWKAITDALAGQMNEMALDDPLRGPLAKLKGYVARLALIVHYLRWACGDAHGEDVDAASMTGAGKLLDYFHEHARKVYAALDADRDLALAHRLIRWVRDGDLRRFTERDAYRALRPEVQRAEDVEPVLSLLERHGFVRAVAVASPPRPGRRASPTFDVHPDV